MTRGVMGSKTTRVGVVMAGGVAHSRTLDKMRPSQSPMRASLLAPEAAERWGEAGEDALESVLGEQVGESGRRSVRPRGRGRDEWRV